MLNRGDVERIVENVLGELTIELAEGNFTDPNNRTIELKFKGKVISSVSFDVDDRDEYEG